MEDYSILELLQKFDKMTTQVDKLINHYGLKEEKPAEEKPAEEKPAEEKPAEEKPAEEKPAEEKPAEEKPAEEKPAETPSLKFIDGDYIWKFDNSTINVKIENGVFKFNAWNDDYEYEFQDDKNKYVNTKPNGYEGWYNMEIKNYDSNTYTYTIRDFAIKEGETWDKTGSLTKVQEKPAEEKPAEEKPAEEKPAEEKPDTDYIKVEIVRKNADSDTIEGESYSFFLWPIEAPDFHKIAKITNSHSTKTISLELTNLYIETYNDQEEFKVIELINENGDKVQTLSANKTEKYTLNVPPGVHYLRIYSDKAYWRTSYMFVPKPPDVYDLPNSILKIRNMHPSSNSILDEFKEMFDSDNYNPLPTSITIDSLTEDQKTYIINEIFSKNNNFVQKYLIFYYANNHFTIYLKKDNNNPLQEIFSATPDSGYILENIFFPDTTETSLKIDTFILYSSEKKPAEEKSVKRKKIIIR